jgi:hypothetical protein
MPTTGVVSNIKVYAFLPGESNAFDTCTVTVIEDVTGISWLFYLWNAPDTDTPVHRVTQSQRLAFLREAAFRNLHIEFFYDADSSIIQGFQVNIPPAT